MIRKICLVVGMAVMVSNAQDKVIAHWTFDALDGNTFHDVSGNGFDAAVSGDSIGIAEGVLGKALWCKGSGFDIIIKNSSPAFALNKFSVEAWVNSSINLVNPGSFYNYKLILNNAYVGMENSGIRGGYDFEISDQGIPYWAASDLAGDNWVYPMSDSTLWPNRWYHLVATYDGLVQKIYVNGVLKGSNDFTGGIKPNPNPAHIACQYQLSDATGKTGHIRNWFVGKIDELSLFNYPLDSQTVAAHYNSLKPIEGKPFKIGLGMNRFYCKPGDTLTVPLMVTNYENFSISALQFALKIDPQKLKLLNVSNDSGIVKDWLMAWNTTAVDSIPISLGGTTAKLGYGDGELLRCVFKVSGSMPVSDSAQIGISTVMVDERSPELITVWTTPGKIYTTTPGTLYGDVNGNKVVNVFDAQEILTYSVGMFKLPDPSSHPNFTEKIADVTGNGAVTSYDAALVFQYSVGLISEFPVQQKALTPKASQLSFHGSGQTANLSINYVSTSTDGMKFNLVGTNLNGFVAGDFGLEYDPASTSAIRSGQIRTSLQNFKLVAYADTALHYYKIGITTNDDVATNDQLVLATITLPPSTSANPVSLFKLKQASINEGKIVSNIISTTSIGESRETLRVSRNAAGQPYVFGNKLILPRNVGEAGLVRLISLNGKIVLQRPWSIQSQTAIDLNGLPKGTYMFAIVKNGRTVKSEMLCNE